MTKERREELKRIIREANEEIHSADREQMREEKKRFVGKCYRGTDTDHQGEKLFAYIFVYEVSEEGLLKLFTFRENKAGTVSISECTHLDTIFEPYFKEISKEELKAAYTDMVAKKGRFIRSLGL